MNIRKKYVHLYNTGPGQVINEKHSSLLVNSPVHTIPTMNWQFLGNYVVLAFHAECTTAQLLLSLTPDVFNTKHSGCPLISQEHWKTRAVLRAPLQRAARSSKTKYYQEQQAAQSWWCTQNQTSCLQHTDIPAVSWKIQAPHLTKFVMTLTSSCSWQVNITKENFSVKMIPVLNSFS